MMTGRAVLSWPSHGWASEPSPMCSSTQLNWPSGANMPPEDRRRDRRGQHDRDEDDHLVDHGALHLRVQQDGEDEAEGGLHDEGDHEEHDRVADGAPEDRVLRRCARSCALRRAADSGSSPSQFQVEMTAVYPMQ